MTILFYSITPQTPFLETELELMQKHLDIGDRVFIARCTWEETKCFVCEYKSKHVFSNAKYNEGLRRINFPKENILTLPIIKVVYRKLPKTFDNINELKKYKWHGVDLGLGVASSLITKFNRDHKLNTNKYKKEIYDELKKSLYVYLASLELLETVKPDLAYAHNGRYSIIRPFVRACQKKNVSFYTHELDLRNDRFTIYKNTFPQDLEYLSADINKFWKKARTDKEHVAKEFFTTMKYGTKKTLWYYFSKKQQKKLLPKEFTKSNKNVVIFNSTIEEYAGFSGWENSLYKDENTGISKILKSFKKHPEIQFYLRNHPNLTGVKNNSQIDEINAIGKENKNLTIIRPDSIISSYAILDKADIVLVFGSTVGVEASYWGKPTILLGRALYENLDCCYQPKTHKEVIELISQKKLKNKNHLGCLKYGYWEMKRGILFKYFKAISTVDGKIKGTFKGSIIKPTLFESVQILFLQLSEPINYKSLEWFSKLNYYIGQIGIWLKKHYLWIYLILVKFKYRNKLNNSTDYY